MLHRSFKPAKCKTALKLAASRIKLLKNKREAQVKHLKRELAQLLESGQDQTARIRVEHVVREEKTMAAYDLLELYCELIVARLPIIESQKNCPIDLKEAISSVIFAAPRCADIPELMDVRKHFTAKYGKEFVSVAIEMRPDCGVSRLLVEKLSAKAPDGPNKIKILSAIAEEHNIKWNPESFGEKDSKPSEDLLNGPDTFEKASKMPVHPSYVQAPHSHDEKGPSNVHLQPKSYEKHDVPLNFHEYNARTSPHSRMDSGANNAKWSGAFHTEFRPTGSGNEGTEFRHSYSGNENAFSSGKQNWNMEFKDATAAAQAAAESAERASMAARAAAELSSRGHTMRQYSAVSQRDEEPQNVSNSTAQSEYHAKGPVNNAVHRRNSRRNYEQTDNNQQDDVAEVAEKFHRDSFKSINNSSQSASLKSSAASIDGNPLVNDLQITGRYSRKNSSEIRQSDLLGQVSLEKQSSNSDLEFMNKSQDSVNFMSVDDFEEVKIRKQSSHASSHSHSSTFGDYHEVVSSLGDDADENPFAVDDKGIAQRNSDKTSSYENAAVVFDDYVSDEDDIVHIEGEHKGDEYSLNFSTSSRKSPTYLFANTDARSGRENIDESQGKSISRSQFSMGHHSGPVFSESTTTSTVPSQPDNMLPATFDDSDGPSSESEEEPDKSKLVRNTDTSKHTVYSRTSEVPQDETHGFIGSSFADEGDVGSSQACLKPSAFDVKPVEIHPDRNQGIRVDAGSARMFGYGDVSTSQSSTRFRASQLDFNDMDGESYNHSFEEGKQWLSEQPSGFSMGQQVEDNVHTPHLAEPTEDTEPSEESSLESHKELNFEMLTGGLRNKGYKHPPFIMSPSGNASSAKQGAKDTSTKIKESQSASVKVSINPGTTNQDPYNREVSVKADKMPSIRLHFGYHDYDSDDELPQHASTTSEDQYRKKAVTDENKKSSMRNQARYLDSTESDSPDDIPNQALTTRARLNTGFSRRTKASPSNTDKATVISEASVTQHYAEERNFPSRNLYGTETRQKSLSQNKSSSFLGNSEQPRLAAQAVYKPIPESKRSPSAESLKLSAKEQTSYSFPKKVTSASTKSLNASGSSVESPSKEKASHVHPKLPDYEALTAHLQSLRQNRQ